MILNSHNLRNNEKLLAKFTCDGEKVCPDLHWSAFPKNTKSFCLIFEDPDAVGGKTFIHWLVINIPVNINGIEEGKPDIPNATALVNDGGSASFIPPCPPPETGKHRYTFKIFALNTPKVDGVTKENFYEKIKPYVVDKAELISHYQRQ